MKHPAGEAVIAKFDVSRETSARLDLFVGLLVRWNQTINLVSRTDGSRLWSRHVADALQLVPLIPPGCTQGTDLGSGAGFPGLVLSLVTGIPFNLIEADTRKASFLREATRETATPARVHACRIEDLNVQPAPLVTARALAPLPKLISLAAPYLTLDGSFLFPKGQEAERELTAARQAWNMRVERFPSQVDSSGLILRISEVARV